MKKINTLFVILCAGLFLFASCIQPDNPVDPNEGNEQKEEVKPETRELTFVLPEASVSGKAKWVAGDKIVVHGEYAANQVEVTLAANNISADGKKATVSVENLYPYKREDVGSTLYAGYPASAVDNLKHCFCYTMFKTTTEPVMAASNTADKDVFQFADIYSVMTFSVTGDYDSYALTGRKDAVVGYEAFQVKITDKEKNYNQYRQGPLVTITGPLTPGAAVQQIWLPGDVELPAGYVLKFFKDGAAKMAYTCKDEVSFTRGAAVDAGDITSKLEEFEMDIDVTKAVALTDESNTANCYIVTEPGIYKFPATKGNTNESVGEIDAVSVLWETWNTTEEVTRKSVILATHYEGGYIYFQTPETLHAGNALIAAKDENEVVLWSWHIWMPKTPVTTVLESNIATREMMTRNLGALVDTPAEGVAPVESFGLVYQWGRKDPFPGIGDPATNEAATIYGTVTYVEGQNSRLGGVQNPNVFYYLDDKDWQNEGNDVVAALWGEASKTIYDPCPPGYFLPARESGPAFWASSDITGKDFVTLTPENYTMKIGAQVFPLAGYIDDADGVHKGAGEYILIWSGRWDSGTQNGYGFSGTVGSDIRRRGTIRSRAGAVRCVKM